MSSATPCANCSVWTAGGLLSPDQPIQLTHSPGLTSGVAGREPCRKIVEAITALAALGQSRGCAAYSDFRELLEKQKDLDAVVVCTTDNLHAPYPPRR